MGMIVCGTDRAWRMALPETGNPSMCLLRVPKISGRILNIIA